LTASSNIGLSTLGIAGSRLSNGLKRAFSFVGDLSSDGEPLHCRNFVWTAGKAALARVLDMLERR
jgi:hypothetical protein